MAIKIIKVINPQYRVESFSECACESKKWNRVKKTIITAAQPVDPRITLYRVTR